MLTVNLTSVQVNTPRVLTSLQDLGVAKSEIYDDEPNVVGLA